MNHPGILLENNISYVEAGAGPTLAQQVLSRVRTDISSRLEVRSSPRLGVLHEVP